MGAQLTLPGSEEPRASARNRVILTTDCRVGMEMRVGVMPTLSCHPNPVV